MSRAAEPTPRLREEEQKHLERIRRILFASDPAWFRRWESAARQSLAGRIRQAGLAERLVQFHRVVENAATRSADPFEVFVVGEVKFGKSTLINALLGTQTAPTDFEPKTWCFNRYIAKKSPSPDALLLVDPQLLARAPGLAARLGRELCRTNGLATYRVSAARAGEIMEEEEKRTLETLDTAVPYVSPILEVEQEVPAAKAVLPGIRLVDTMGMNGIRERKGHLHYLAWQYGRADAVLWVVSARNLNSRGTREQLEMFGAYRKRAVVVINRWDEVEDKPRVAGMARELYGGFAEEVVFLSALAASIGAAGVPPESLPARQRGPLTEFMRKSGVQDHGGLLQASGFEDLRAALKRQFDGKLEAVRNESAYNAIGRQEREFRKMAETVLGEYRDNLATFERLRQSVAETETACRRSVSEGCRQLGQQLEKGLESALQSLTYERCASVGQAVNVESFLNQARSEQQRLAGLVKERFDGLVRRFHGEENGYAETAFGPGATVAERQRAASVDPVSVRVTPLELKLQLQGESGGFLLDLYDRVEDGFLGFFASLFFSGWAEQKREEVVKSTRTRVRQELSPALRALAEKCEKHLAAEAESAAAGVRQSATGRAARLGPVEAQRDSIRRLETVLAAPPPPPPWLAAILGKIKERTCSKNRR